MAEEVGSLELCALNIAASPHPDGIYLKLLSTAAEHSVRFWGDSFASISTPIATSSGFYRGRVVIWSEIDESEPAIDKGSLEEISFESLGIILPNNIGFNGKVFQYIFRELDHSLFIETSNEFGKKISPLRAKKIFSLLFDMNVQGAGAPLVEVTIRPDADALLRILAIPKLKSLHIHIVRPNADDIDPQNILNKLINQGARSQDIILKAAAGPDGLTPDDQTRSEAEVAAQNGYVKGSGSDEDGEAIQLSTQQHPWLRRVPLDGFSSAFEGLLAVVREAIFGPTHQ